MRIEAKREFENLAREATRCRECFIRGEVTAPYIDVAQPRWVGQKYWESSFRVLVLMINRGRSPKNSASAREFLRRVRAFRDGTMELDELLERQRKAMESSWARFRRFYISGLALDFDDVAFANATMSPSRTWLGAQQRRMSILNRCSAVASANILARSFRFCGRTWFWLLADRCALSGGGFVTCCPLRMSSRPCTTRIARGAPRSGMNSRECVRPWMLRARRVVLANKRMQERTRHGWNGASPLNPVFYGQRCSD